MSSPVAQVRSFNRTVATAIGAMDPRFLGRERPMGEARLLWEIGAGADIRELRDRLGLDSGYVSRMLRSLERQDLVTIAPSTPDRRLRRVVPTPAGLQEQAELDRRSDVLAAGILDALAPDERDRMVDAMRTVERLLVRAQTTIEPVDASSAEVRWCFGRFLAELDARFDGGFDPSRSLPADPADLVPPKGLVLLARHRGAPAGTVAAKLHLDGTAEIKRMWIAPHLRGSGLGGRLLAAIESHARAAGATRARLETNRALAEAIALYRRTGYVEVERFSDEPYADHWLQKSLV